MQEIIKDMLVWQASYSWILLELFIVFLLYIWFKFFKKSWIIIIIELLFEKVYEFFEEILGLEEKRWIKIYITLVFFIILISNLLWVWLELLTPIFWEFTASHPLVAVHPELLGHHVLEHYIKIPTADINFNVAMAVVWVLIVILEQFKSLGFWKALHTYVPIKGMDLIPYERWKLPVVLDYIVFWIVKFFDIWISLFLWVLEIVWHAAKIISLSFRLFWNMTSGWILLAMLIGALSGLTMNLLHIEFPVVGPIILYVQELLVAVIQALVFPLLVAIFIKVAKVH